MSKSRRKKKHSRPMAETEYRGYKRYHRSVEHAGEREGLKARNTQADATNQRRGAKRKMDHALQRGDFDEIEDMENELQKAERKMRGARGRSQRKKSIEGYEEKNENAQRS